MVDSAAAVETPLAPNMTHPTVTAHLARAAVASTAARTRTASRAWARANPGSASSSTTLARAYTASGVRVLAATAGGRAEWYANARAGARMSEKMAGRMARFVRAWRGMALECEELLVL